MSDRLPGSRQYRTPAHYRRLTHRRLLQILEYDQATGVFRWKVEACRNRKVGSVAGGKTNIIFDGLTYAKSHLAWFYVTGAWSKRTIGRLNGQSADVHFANLVERASGGYGHDLNTVKGRAAYRAAHKAANPRLHHGYQLNRYGGLITPEQYAATLKKQKGRCAICKQAETSKVWGTVKALAVDHCHVTNAFRGLFCDRCNRLLGAAKDSAAVLIAAARYLRRSRK